MIIANWKCNGSKLMINEWFESYQNMVKNKGVGAGILCIAPPALFIKDVKDQIKNNNLDIKTISQDITGYKRKFTGAISADMLLEIWYAERATFHTRSSSRFAFRVLLPFFPIVDRGILKSVSSFLV